MIIVSIICFFLFLPKIIDAAKLTGVVLIEVIRLALVFGTFPALFYLSVYLKTKGH